MEPLFLQVSEKSNSRRSQRVLLSVPIGVIMQTPQSQPVTEETSTLVVNAHGALVLLKMKVAIGTMITLKNFKTSEEIACRVVHSSNNLSGKSEVGVEFIEPSPKFWRIAFPPVDWTPRSPDAKGFTPRPAEKQTPLPKK